jgi:PAS domain S-box-containing protein
MSKNRGVEDNLSRNELVLQIPGFIRNAPVGAHLYELRDGELYFKGANVAADKILQTDHSKFIGQTIEKIFPDLIQLGIPEIYKNIAKKGTAWNSDEVKYSDGQVVHYFKVNAFQTNPGHMIALFTEITELKNIEMALKIKNDELLSVEEELREKNQKLVELNALLQKQNDQLIQTFTLLQESEEKFRAAFKTSPDSVNINRLQDGTYFEINEGFTQLTGFTWDDVRGRSSTDINIWYDPHDRIKLVEAIQSTGKAINMEAKFRLKSGEIRTGLMSATLFKYRGESYVMSVTRDIEEIVRARALVRESEQRFIQFAENIDDVFWLSEGDRVLYLNSALERTFGFDRTSLMHNINSIGKMVHPEDLPVYDELTGIRRTGRTEPMYRQLRIIDPTGKVRWVWARLFPILDDNNKLYRIAGIVTDITLLKEIEQELRAAKESAQESDHLKSAFLANLSHEIRTPMNAILGFSRLLFRNDADPEVREQYLDIISSSSDHLLHIIEDLVDISKIESNQMHIVKQECKLNAMLDDLYFLFSQQLRQADKTAVRFFKHYEFPDDGCSIITDEFRLRQVLINLLGNAVKFTDSGHIRFGYTLSARDSLRFFVEDTGIGISEEQTRVIFEPFRQADNKSTREYGGAGLGLTISRGLVKLLGGTLGLESKPGAGSTFYFTLPYQPVSADVESVEFSVVQERGFHWDNRTILIVEDDEMNFRFLEEVLYPSGVRIKQVTNGVDAVEEATRQHFDLIIMDIRLPVMNGLDATRKIRETGNKVFIIAQTAYAMEEDKKACLEAGCNDYLSKPVTREAILKMIAYYFEQSQEN